MVLQGSTAASAGAGLLGATILVVVCVVVVAMVVIEGFVEAVVVVEVHTPHIFGQCVSANC